MAKITVGDLNLTGVSSTPFLRDNSCQLRMVKPGVSFKQITAVLAANEADDILFEASDGRLFVLSEDALSSGWHLDEFAVFGERVSVPDSIALKFCASSKRVILSVAGSSRGARTP